MDRGAWWATVHGVAKSRPQLIDQARTHTHITSPVLIYLITGSLEVCTF